MYVQLLKQGTGCALIDPHGDLAVDILGTLADARFFDRSGAFERLLYVDFGDASRCVPFNVLRQLYDDHAAARNVVEACKRAWPALAGGAAPQFENILLAGSFVLVQNKLPLTELPPDIAPLGESLARLTGLRDAWERGTTEQRNAALKEIFESVTLDTKEKEVAGIRVTPHPDWAPLFDARREYVVGGKLPPVGLEPTTSWSEAKHSIQLSYGGVRHRTYREMWDVPTGNGR